MDVNPQGLATAMVNLHIRHIKKYIRSKNVKDQSRCIVEINNFLNQNPNLRNMFNKSTYTKELLLKAVYE